MYLKQFWRCFEETGNVETYLDLKEYEKLYKEHTNSAAIEDNNQSNQDGLDGMS